MRVENDRIHNEMHKNRVEEVEEVEKQSKRATHIMRQPERVCPVQ